MIFTQKKMSYFANSVTTVLTKSKITSNQKLIWQKKVFQRIFNRNRRQSQLLKSKKDEFVLDFL